MLNQVKQGFQFAYATFQAIKSSEKVYYCWDVANFAFGFFGLYHLFQDPVLENHEVSSCPGQPWQQRASRMIDLFGNLSFVLGGMTTGPALTIWNRTAPVLLSSTQLARIPGNKIHYSLGVLSFILGVPATLKTLYAIYTWMKGSNTHQEEEREVKEIQKNPRAYKSLSKKKHMDMVRTIKIVSQATAKFTRLSLR